MPYFSFSFSLSFSLFFSLSLSLFLSLSLYIYISLTLTLSLSLSHCFSLTLQNGGDATAAIRESGFDRLIIGLTGNALNDDVSSFLHSGADCVLAKPLTAAQMESVLSHARMHGFQSNPKVKYQMETVSGQKCTLRFL
jgi:DNA-binding NarL/FixJ family response regulator